MAVQTGDFKVIGTSPVRHDGVDKVTGRAQYGADVALPGTLYGKVLRSPHAHARVVSIDASGAQAFPGVFSVITSGDLPTPAEGETGGGEGGEQQNIKHKSANMLAREKVLYDGHAVAAVAAVDFHTADEALRRIKVEYEVLEPVLDVRMAMEPDAPVLNDDVFTDTGGAQADQPSNLAQHIIYAEGDMDAGFAAADVVIEREFTTATVHQGYIETHNATAVWGADGYIKVWCSTQGAFSVRSELSDLLQVPIFKIKVIPAEIGGGFGGKTTVYLEPLAALLSRKSGRPVKMTMDRAEVLKATGPTPGAYMRVKIGATNDGDITALESWIAFEAGGYPGSPLDAGCKCAFAPYKLTNFRVDGFDVTVNKPKSHAYRAPGATITEFAVEAVVDEVSEALDMDPVEFRLRNAAQEGTMRADGLIYPPVGNIECVEAARDSDHWQTPLERVPGKKRGRGFASGFWFNWGGTSSATGRLNPDGTVTLTQGSTDIGGTRTSVAMQLAEPLGIPVEDVNPIVGDTDSVGYTDVTGGSRVTYCTGQASFEVAQEMIRQIIAGLAEAWEEPAEAVMFENGSYSANGTTATLKEAAAILNGNNIEVVATASVTPEREGGAFAVHVADVEVDEETGKVEILRYTAVQDAGIAIYPPYVEGQMQGGVVQGIGWALNEEYFYDSDGRLRNASLLDYRMPTALDLPMVETIIVEVPNPDHPYGVRGVGEVPIVPPPAAIANAIYDAVGVRMRDLPMAPHKISRAISENGRK